MDITPYLGTIVTVVIAFIGFYGAVSTRLARTEQRIDDLVNTVNKHNNVIERTFKLETEMATAYKRIDELRERDERLEDKLDNVKIGGSE